MIDIGDNIRRIRLFKNLSREEVAEKLGLTVSGFSKIEQGQTDLTISRIEEIAKILDVSTSQLLDLANSQVINITNLHSQQVVSKSENMHIHTDEYMARYIQKLEQDNKRLEAEIESLKKGKK